MERGRRAIEADIGGERPRSRLLVQALEIRALMDEAALDQRAQEIGFWGEIVRGSHEAG